MEAEEISGTPEYYSEEFEEGSPLEAITELKEISEERMELANALLGWSKSLDEEVMPFENYCTKKGIDIDIT